MLAGREFARVGRRLQREASANRADHRLPEATSVLLQHVKDGPSLVIEGHGLLIRPCAPLQVLELLLCSLHFAGGDLALLLGV